MLRFMAALPLEKKKKKERWAKYISCVNWDFVAPRLHSQIFLSWQEGLNVNRINALYKCVDRQVYT